MADTIMKYAQVAVPALVIFTWLGLEAAQAFNPNVTVSPDRKTAAFTFLGVFGGVVIEKARVRLRDARATRDEQRVG